MMSCIKCIKNGAKICLIKSKMPIAKLGETWYNIKAIRTSAFSAVVFPFSGDKSRAKHGGGKFIFINQEEF